MTRTQDRTSPFRTLGTAVAGAPNARQAMIDAGMDWTVEQHPISATIELPAQITADGVDPARSLNLPIKNRVANVRERVAGSGRYDVLGVVGDTYQVVQNVDNADFLDALTEQSGAVIETAGEYNHGRRTFVTMKLPEALMVGGSDRTDLHFIATNSHDGTAAFQISVAPVRMVCLNQNTMMLAQAVSKFTIYHRRNALNNIAQAQQALGLTFRYAAEFEAACEALLLAHVPVRKELELVQAIYVPTFDKKSGAETKQSADRRDRVLDLYRHSETNAFGRGSAYAMWNAVTEYEDWFKPVAGKGDPEMMRATRTARGGSQGIKDRALRILQEV